MSTLTRSRLVTTKMASSVTFNAPAGPINAYRHNGLIYAKGIPYAQAKRFQKPSTVPIWSSPLDASKPSPACPQIKDEVGEALLRKPLLAGLEFSEDCLNLSITLPDTGEDSKRTKLPVLVFIHGGAYVSGAGDAQLYDPTSIVREQNILVVMVNYRLGLFGYIGNGSPERPANLGLLDQISAMKWIRSNISSFGGDERNVTVAGQSAGADAVMHMLALETAPELFDRAIIQSAPLGIRGGRFKMSDYLFKHSKDLTTESPAQEVIDRTASGIAAVRTFGLIAGMCMATQYNLDPLPAEDELDRIWEQNAQKIDILIGSTREEISMFVDAIPGLATVFSIPALGGWLQEKLVRFFTRKVYEDETHRVSKVLAKGGRTWLYDFFWHAKGNKYKSSHAIDLILEWGNREAYENSKFADGATWEEIDEHGRRFREFLAMFVKGQALPVQGEVEHILKYKKVGS